jgi:hypothetical protein
LPEKERTNSQTKKDPAVPENIGAEIGLFVTQIDALADTLPLAAIAIQEVSSTSSQQLATFLNEECKVISHEGTKKSYSLEPGQQVKFQRFMRRVHKADLAKVLVPRGLLVAIVSQFDAYVGGLIRQLFKLRPELLETSERILTYSQLLEFGSIDEAREYVIEKEIESVLRESHTDQFTWLEKKFALPLRKELPAWPLFIEVTERRNLFVHTNGHVSGQYLEVCRKHSCKIPYDVCAGMPLSVTREYFAAASECLWEVGVKLGQVLWRKVQPSEIDVADVSLNDMALNLITEGRYQLAQVLLDFATETLKTHTTANSRLSLVMNRAQAYKWGGDEESCKRILNAEDWTATNLKFRLAYEILRDDFKEANAIVRQIGKDDRELSKHAYREWPIFRVFRKSPEFIALFEQIFDEPFNKFIVDTETDTSNPQKVN